MKLKGSEMGTKMQKIESRNSSFKRENFGKLQQAVGPGDRLTTPICGQHSTAPPLTILSNSSSMVVLGHLSQILSYC